MRLPLRLLSKAETLVAFAVLLGLVVTLQVADGANAQGLWSISGHAGLCRDLVVTR